MQWAVEYRWISEPNEAGLRMLEAIKAALPPDAEVKIARLIEMPQEMSRFDDGCLRRSHSVQDVSAQPGEAEFAEIFEQFCKK